jgi:hypothetical protein
VVPDVCFRAGIVDVLKLEALDRRVPTVAPAHHLLASRGRPSRILRHMEVEHVEVRGYSLRKRDGLRGM